MLPRAITGISTSPHRKVSFWAALKPQSKLTITAQAAPATANENNHTDSELQRHRPRISPQSPFTWERAVSRTTNCGRPSWEGIANTVINENANAYTP